MSTLGTPLHIAAAAGNIAEVQRLIAAGENPNAQNSLGWTPIYFAIISDEEETMQTLIGLGADIDVTDSNSKTVFNFAISCGKIGPAQILLDAGAKTTPEERAFLEHLKVNGLPRV